MIRERILVGVDFKEQSGEALRQGEAWAAAHGWELIACHVELPPVDMLFPQRVEGEALAEPEIEQERQRTIRDHVARFTRREPTGVRVLFETGDAGAELERVAAREGVRLLVVGSPARPRLKHALLGHVAEHLVRHAHCSVLVARPHRPTGRILVGTDLSPAALPAVRLAVDHAARVRARLTLACSVERRAQQLQGMTNLGAGYGFLEGEDQELHRAAERALEAQLRAVGGTGETVVLEGPPAAALARAADASDVELLVIGTRGASGHLPRRLGPGLSQVVRIAPCSVLLVRGEA